MHTGHTKQCSVQFPAFVEVVDAKARLEGLLRRCLLAGALSSFISEKEERKQVMEAVGDACEQEEQMEAAREVYLAAPNPCAALRILNRQLSDLIPSSITDQTSSRSHCLSFLMWQTSSMCRFARTQAVFSFTR